jgi:TPR repeat protein
MYVLGCRLLNGEGVPTNTTKAVELLRKAAEMGHTKAQRRLGSYYLVAGDPDEARPWITQAAEAGDPEAQCALALDYALGLGIRQSDVEALKWYRKAADTGLAMAQASIARCYANGLGVKADQREAVTWYRKAAEQGDATAQYSLGWHYENGEGVEKRSDQARKWYRKAADQGNDTAQLLLGLIYYHEATGGASQEVAATWLRRSAEQGNTKAQLALGHCYGTGTGVPKSYVESYKWYNIAAAAGGEGARKACEALAAQMTPDQVAEAQRLSTTFTPKTNAPNPVR